MELRLGASLGVVAVRPMPTPVFSRSHFDEDANGNKSPLSESRRRESSMLVCALRAANKLVYNPDMRKISKPMRIRAMAWHIDASHESFATHHKRKQKSRLFNVSRCDDEQKKTSFA
jgi:hypothetical protein